MTKTCTKCGTERSLDEFYSDKSTKSGRGSACKPCRKQQTLDYYFSNHEDVKRRRTELRARPEKRKQASDRERVRRHGVTASAFEVRLAKQDGRCAICGTLEPGGRGTFHIDHDHACCGPDKSCVQCQRGLLCGSCNVAVRSREWLEAALRYVTSFEKS